MYETIISGLILAFISTLAVLAYRFPKLFSFIYKILHYLAWLIFLMLFSYYMSIHIIYMEAIEKSCDCAKEIINNKSFSWLTVNIVFILFQLYIYLLVKIHNIIHYFEDNEPKNEVK